jgi:hypothetical protein
MDFHRYGKIYRLLINPTGDDYFADFAARLKTWDVSTIYPLVIYLIEESDLTHEQVKRCLSDLESFVVRRLICGMTAKEYNKYFVDIVGRLRAFAGAGTDLRAILLEGRGDTRSWPNDEVFLDRWLQQELYSSLRSDQIVGILRVIEDTLRSSKSESIVIHQASIEHIMPQQWATNYTLDGVQVDPAMAGNWFYSADAGATAVWESVREKVRQRNHIIHTIGNLTIVTQPLNLALRNGSFQAKKVELRHSSLMLNQYFNDLSEWDETSIQERAIHLGQLALRLWPYPGRQRDDAA